MFNNNNNKSYNGLDLNYQFVCLQYEGAIDPHGLVHHLEVFHCEVPRDERIEDYNAPCGVMADRPKGLGACRKVIGAWAIGAEVLSYIWPLIN